ncbi:MAG: hypothetical protein JWP08_2229 [Bryobacterales bacterium]|nr:hypothetical protein [Bryobacterales bacterium]
MFVTSSASRAEDVASSKNAVWAALACGRNFLASDIPKTQRGWRRCGAGDDRGRTDDKRRDIAE